MNRAALPVLGFAALITALTVVLYVWSPDDWVAWTVFAAGSATAWAAGLLAAVSRRRDEARELPGASLATILIAAGVAWMLFGALVGVWLTLIGAGAVALGLAGLAAERRAR